MQSPVLIKILQSAREFGFLAAGLIKIEIIPAAARDRADLPQDTRSLLVLAYPYPDRSLKDIFTTELDIYLSRYARGQDYHLVLGEKLKSLSKELSGLTGKNHSWTGVDNHPLDEKRIAARAGLGFIGRNSLVIIPGIGSLVFLGLIASPVDFKGDTRAVSLKPDADFSLLEPEKSSRCRNCHRCVRTCPGGALSSQGKLTGEKCISQLTQQPGYLDISQLELIDNHFWGCDDCQLVCPYNSQHISRPDWRLPGKIFPRDFFRPDYSSFPEYLSRYPFSWRGNRILQRNMLIAISNLKARNYKTEKYNSDDCTAENYTAGNQKAEKYNADNYITKNNKNEIYNADNYISGNHKNEIYNADNNISGNHKNEIYNADNNISGNNKNDIYNADNNISGNYKSSDCKTGNYISGNYKNSKCKTGNYQKAIFQLSKSPSPVIRYYCGYYYFKLAAVGKKSAAVSLTSLLRQEKDPEARSRLAALIGRLE